MLTVTTCLGLASLELASLEAQTPPASETPAGRPLGAPAAFAAGDREMVEIPGGATVRRSPSLASTVAFEFPDEVGERVEVLERRENSSGVWIRIRFAGIYGWFLERAKQVDQVAAFYENPSRMERRSRLAELARSHFARQPTELTWTLDSRHENGVAAGEPTVSVPVRIFSDRGRRVVRPLRELGVCLPDLYASRFGPVTSSGPLPVDIFVFADQEEYERFAAQELATSIQESGGLELDGLVLIDGEATDLNVIGTVAHELAHVLNRFSFAQEQLPVWIEEAIAEDVAHAVEEALVLDDSLCSRPGGWSRTRVVESTEFVDGKATRRSDTQRSGRGRSILCYEGPGVDDPDVRDMTALEFGASYRRPTLYLEALLLLRDLLRGVERTRVRQRLVEWQRADDLRSMGEVAERALAALPWRSVERTWMSCPG